MKITALALTLILNAGVAQLPVLGKQQATQYVPAAHFSSQHKLAIASPAVKAASCYKAAACYVPLPISYVEPPTSTAQDPDALETFKTATTGEDWHFVLTHGDDFPVQ